MGKNLKWVIIFISLIFAASSVAAFWNQFLVPIQYQEFLVQIGDQIWNNEIIEENPGLDVGEINDIVSSIIASEPLLQDGITRLHILGQDNGNNTPNYLDSVGYFDVIIWVRENGTVTVALATAPIDVNIFDSWESLEMALESPNIALTAWGDVFSSGNIYTRTHVPILHNSQLWFARHDNVTSEPIVGDDWFLIGDDWIPQSYPNGSIVMYQNRHFYKISDDAQPSLDIDAWREIPLYEAVSDVMTWYHTYWDAYYIVVFQGNYYISLVDNNVQVPGTGDDWLLIPRFDSVSIVPEFIMGTHYEIGDVVRVGHGADALHFRKMIDGTSPNPIGDTSGAWLLIQNWRELTEVQTWRPYILYGNGFVGLVVEHNGQFFEKLDGWASLGMSPSEQPMVWRRVLTWNESIAPLNHQGSDVYEANTIFRSTVDGAEHFFVSIQDVPAGFQGSVSMESEFFRPVEEWDSEQVYTVFGHAIWDVGFNRRYHAYTLDEHNNRIFWVLRDSPTGITGTVFGIHPENSPFWEQVEFFSHENVVTTFMSGAPVIWSRNPNIPLGAYIRAPSVLHNDWIRRETMVSDEFVYTIDDDNIFDLWRRISPDPSQQEPGAGNDWERESFKTGIEFMYTVNEAGVVTFWHSPTQSSTPPGGSGWTVYSPPIMKQAEIVYFELDDEILYFATNRGDNLFHLSTAWIGGSEIIRYHWNVNNEYQEGDVVVFGTTQLNTYRYFRLRPGILPGNTRGISPMSHLGRQIWQPLRLID